MGDFSQAERAYWNARHVHRLLTAAGLVLWLLLFANRCL